MHMPVEDVELLNVNAEFRRCPRAADGTVCAHPPILGWSPDPQVAVLKTQAGDSG